MSKPYIKNLWIKRLEYHTPQTIDYSSFYRKYKMYGDEVIYIKSFGKGGDRRSPNRNKDIHIHNNSPKPMVQG